MISSPAPWPSTCEVSDDPHDLASCRPRSLDPRQSVNQRSELRPERTGLAVYLRVRRGVGAMSEEYTPTTDEMRNVYASVQALGIRSGPPGAIEYNHGKAKFDRWLAEVERAAAEKAWHEGFCRGEVSGGREWPINPHTENPYRHGGSDERAN